MSKVDFYITEGVHQQQHGHVEMVHSGRSGDEEQSSGPAMWYVVRH